MDNTITNRANGELASVTGRGVNAFRLRAIIIGLEFKAKTGMEVDRRFSILKVAKQTTGLRTNKIPVLVAELKRLHDIEVDACTITTQEVRSEARRAYGQWDVDKEVR